MVLSQLYTFTVVSDTSSTVPLAGVPGTTIQSPTWSMSFCDSCTPATRPRMLFLNISIRAAAKAPRPARSTVGLLSSIIDMLRIATMIHTMPWATLRMPRSGRLRVFSCSS